MANKLTSTQRNELKEAFDVFDTDGSGKVSASELGRILKALNIKFDDNQLKQLVQNMDSNGSGLYIRIVSEEKQKCLFLK
ncbi:unnamed protein product [Adineta steineri]|uniref:EF-hand domain-containing protein n=1 Tax=Adineta steineri TaxID=433720 RepID=A0A813RCA5_9BILA|nr:unnamed protein product [Adineta steineri]